VGVRERVLEYPPQMRTNGYKAAAVHPELAPAKLRWRCEPARLPFETTAQAEPREGFIGQERALRALKMGVELSAPGYNVFVCGLAGTSRGGTIAHMIEELHPQTKPSLDRCYVNNFKITDRPRLLALPRGQANGFKRICRRESIFCGGGFRKSSKANRSSGRRVGLSSGSRCGKKS
jgi:hypothetical protein